LLALTFLVAALIPTAGITRSARADTFFPQTGYSLWGPFEAYWQAHGGLEQFGLPRTSVYPAGSAFDAQWFERALFTYDPSKPDPHKVELNLLGSMITEGRDTEPPFRRASAASGATYFEATGHNLSGTFLRYWQDTGGLAIYGYPVSEPFTERSKSDGKNYLVQYFERNRFEHHPEAAGTKWEVQLGLLGSELLDAMGGPQAVAALGGGKHYPLPLGGINIPPGEIVDSPNAGTPEPSDNTVPAAPALPSTGKAVLFSANFASPDMNDWQARGGYSPPDVMAASWRIKDGMLHQSGIAGEEDASIDALFVTRTTTATDAVLEALAFPAGGEPLGLVLRWTSDGYYVAKLYARSDNTQPKAAIVKVIPQGQTTLARSEGWPGYTPRQWHIAGFSAKGNALTLTLNGQVIAQATDSQLTGGNFGFYAYADGRAYFDNARLTLP
jgi:hypothetical protein